MSEQTQGNSADVDSPKVYLIAIVLGAGVGVISIGFLAAVKTAKNLIWTSDLQRISPLVVLGICVVGGLLVGVLNQLAEKSRSEIHDLTEAIADMEEVETKQAPPARLMPAAWPN